MAYDSLRILEPKNKSFNLYSLETFSKNFFLKPGFFDLIIKFILFAFVVLSGIMK